MGFLMKRWGMLLLPLLALAATVAGAQSFGIFQVSGPGGACWAPGGGSDGWTVICATATTSGTCAAGTANGTCFIAADSTKPSDTNCLAAGLQTTSALALANACQHLQTAWGLMRDGKPDQMWLACGSTFATSDSGIFLNKNGVSPTSPMAIIGNTGCANRPQQIGGPSNSQGGPCFNMGQGGGGAGKGDYIAIINTDCYGSVYDPNNAGSGFDATTVPIVAGNIINGYHWFLFEGNRFSYFNGSCMILDNQDGNFHYNTYLIRNIFVHCYPPGDGGSHGQCIHGEFNFQDFTFKENVFDTCGLDFTLTAPQTATFGGSNSFITANFFSSVLPLGAQVEFHSNGDTLPTNLSFATGYFPLGWGANGANTLVLSNAQGSQFTATISTTALAVSAMEATSASGNVITKNDHLYFSGMSGSPTITTCPGGTISNAVWSSANGGTFTFTTTSSHGVAIGNRVLVENVTPAGFNGSFIAATGTTGSTLVVTNVGGTLTYTSGGDLCGQTGTYTISVSQTVGSPTFMTSGVPLNMGTGGSGTHLLAWDVPAASPSPTGFNHCAYIATQNGPLLSDGNIYANCAGTAWQLRSGGELKHNLVTLSSTAGTGSNIHDNVIIGMTGWGSVCGSLTNCPLTDDGPNMNGLGPVNQTITNNLVANAATGSSPGATALFTKDSNDDCSFPGIPQAWTFNFSTSFLTNHFEYNPTGNAIGLCTQPSGSFFCASTTCNGGGTLPASIGNLTTYFTLSSTANTDGSSTYQITTTPPPGGSPVSIAGQSSSGAIGAAYFVYGGSITGNVIYNHGDATGNANISNTVQNSGTVTISGNTNVNLGGGSFPGCSGSVSNCTIGGYNAQISGCASLPAGCTATTAAFLTNAESNSKNNWNPNLTAKAAATWIAAGFGITIH
jgi:hypothetical protein